MILHVQVLCASNAAHDQVDPIIPPEDVPVGERISFEGFNNKPDAQLNPKKNVFGKLAPDLQTNAGELVPMPCIV
jgi:aminoacyl tRNA synthase complex-interacting multifunctional protein 1